MATTVATLKIFKLNFFISYGFINLLGVPDAEYSEKNIP
jgi:hypothetical protein